MWYRATNVSPEITVACSASGSGASESGSRFALMIVCRRTRTASCTCIRPRRTSFGPLCWRRRTPSWLALLKRSRAALRARRWRISQVSSKVAEICAETCVVDLLSGCRTFARQQFHCGSFCGINNFRSFDHFISAVCFGFDDR